MVCDKDLSKNQQYIDVVVWKCKVGEKHSGKSILEKAQNGKKTTLLNATQDRQPKWNLKHTHTHHASVFM